MQLSNAWVCPRRMRVRIALAEKHLRYREREIDLASEPKELFGVNPAGGVPVLAPRRAA